MTDCTDSTEKRRRPIPRDLPPLEYLGEDDFGPVYGIRPETMCDHTAQEDQ